MSLFSALSTYLRADAGVAAALSGRISSQHANQGADTPYAVFQRVSGQPWNDLAGYGQKTRVRVQFDFYGSSLASARIAASSVISALRAATDAPLRGCIQLSDRDLYDDENRLHRVTMDWAFYVQE